MSIGKPASPWYFIGATGGITDAAAHAIVGATSAQRNFCTGLQYFNSAAVASEIVLVDHVSSAVLWRGMAPASMTVPQAIVFDPPIQSGANAGLDVQMLTTATATRVSAQGFTDP